MSVHAGLQVSGLVVMIGATATVVDKQTHGHAKRQLLIDYTLAHQMK